MTIEDFKKKFLEAGLGFTEQRREIAEVILTAKNHPDIDEIFLEVKKIDKSASIATVYRNVNLFTHLGLISKRDFKDTKSRYELKSPTEHNHIILEDGSIIEFESEELENIIKSIAFEHNLILKDYNIELYCIKKQKL
jgi:Fur family ferric uptake transcriptional regulator